jgi:hypothetical protein
LYLGLPNLLHFIYTVFGLYDATYGTGVSGASILATTDEDDLLPFANAPHGSFYGKDPDTVTGTNVARLYDYGEYSAADLANLNTTGAHYFVSAGAGAVSAVPPFALSNSIAVVKSANAKSPDAAPAPALTK